MKYSICYYKLLLTLNVVIPVRTVTLQAGANLDLNVVVMVQKSFEREGCQDLHLLDKCLRRKCTQKVLYKVDLGYSKVRRSADGKLTNYSQSKVERNNEILRKIALKSKQMQNDAFQPFLFAEFKRLTELFYNGHSRILGLFKISMEDLINEKLEKLKIGSKNSFNCLEEEITGFEQIRKKLVKILENNWGKSNLSSKNKSKFSINFFEVIKRGLIPSPIQMIDAMNNPKENEAIIKHTNQLFLLLARLSTLIGQQKLLKEKCRSFLKEVDNIIENEPLIARLNYSPSRSLFIRDLEALLQTRAARGQTGYYYENNMATIRFRFMSMTAIIMEESREYNNFNLMVDLGSTLGLYFGLTILTIFELAIFLLYRSASHNPAEVQKPPPESIIYNIPVKNTINKKSEKLKQRKKKKHYVIPIVS